jgi:uncharacterized protein YlaI
MIYPTYTKKKKCFIAILMANIFILTGLTSSGNALNSYKINENTTNIDFGTQPLGISQTTRKLYLLASDSEQSQKHEKVKITIIENKEVKKKQVRQRNIHRWNIPNSRSRVNMNRWLKKTKKNQSPIHIESPYISGDNPNAFTIKDNQCNQNKLLPGKSCQFEVSFTPQVEGQQRANIVIPYSHHGIYNNIIIIVNGTAQKKGCPKMALLP